MENLEQKAKEVATFLDGHNLPDSRLNLLSLSEEVTPSEMSKILKLASNIESKGQGTDLVFAEAGFSRCLPAVRIGGAAHCHDELRTVVNLTQNGSESRIGQIEGPDREFEIDHEYRGKRRSNDEVDDATITAWKLKQAQWERQQVNPATDRQTAKDPLPEY